MVGHVVQAHAQRAGPPLQHHAEGVQEQTVVHPAKLQPDVLEEQLLPHPAHRRLRPGGFDRLHAGDRLYQVGLHLSVGVEGGPQIGPQGRRQAESQQCERRDRHQDDQGE